MRGRLWSLNEMDRVKHLVSVKTMHEHGVPRATVVFVKSVGYAYSKLNHTILIGDLAKRASPLEPRASLFAPALPEEAC